MAPHTPPPGASSELAAFTMASTLRVVISTSFAVRLRSALDWRLGSNSFLRPLRRPKLARGEPIWDAGPGKRHPDAFHRGEPHVNAPQLVVSRVMIAHIFSDATSEDRLFGVRQIGDGRIRKDDREVCRVVDVDTDRRRLELARQAPLQRKDILQIGTSERPGERYKTE